MCVPTDHDLRQRGRPRQRFVGPALRGEEIWCQLFSEPAGGSDVAAARTRAVRDGDDWVINGQKVWTSRRPLLRLRHRCIIRTDPDVPKHKGLTMFWLDMASPGIDVRPIHQMSGASELQRGLFHRPAGEGQPAPGRGRRRLAGLAGDADERAAGRRRRRRPRLTVDHVAGARAADRQGHGALRPGVPREARRLVRAGRGAEVHPLPHHDGAVARPDAGAGKLDRQDHRRAASCRTWPTPPSSWRTSSASSTIRRSRPLRAAFQGALLSAPGLRIAGGTDEILQNIIAERVLGLPRRDPRRQGRAVQGHAPRTVVDEREGNHGKHGKHGRPACVAR